MLYSTCEQYSASHQSINQPIDESINMFNVMGGNWDLTHKKFNLVNSYRQDLLSTCKASVCGICASQLV